MWAVSEVDVEIFHISCSVSLFWFVFVVISLDNFLDLQQEGEFNHHEGIDLYDDVITAPSGEGEPVSICVVKDFVLLLGSLLRTSSRAS